ncbi:unnamed protein product [Owenia fusiformis]|uniref:F5/8 type C domain-containing protein n=1 Tax=Owenia fusiformis TaxID=6347 RepID=A0A8S4QB21_OWEFU|nr:unnamed protein product [Owenia fusiformis]
MYLLLAWFFMTFLAIVGLTFAKSSPYETFFKRGILGQSLDDRYTFESVPVQGLAECSRLCQLNDHCYSFNFEHGATGMAQCGLVYCNADVNDSALVSNTAMTYYRQVLDEQGPLCTHLALKSTNQSSTAINGYSHRAVDGDYTIEWNADAPCTHTNAEEKAWWMVDLEGMFNVNAVRLVNRKEVPERLKHFKIEVSNDTVAWDLCVYHQDVLENNQSWQLFNCPNHLVGSYLRVQLDHIGVLTLCEVEVYGFLTRN